MNGGHNSRGKRILNDNTALLTQLWNKRCKALVEEHNKIKGKGLDLMQKWAAERCGQLLSHSDTVHFTLPT